MQRNKIISRILVAITMMMPALSGHTQSPVQINLATLKTTLRQDALQLGISYAESLDSMWERQDFLLAGKNSLLLITPNFQVQTGSSDAFSSITAMVTGLGMVFRDTTVAGVVTPNTARTFHTFPASVGVETNNTFSIINALAEAGWSPWYQAAGRTTVPKWVKRTKLGVFLQGGYKFVTDSTARSNAAGGAADESMESANGGIFRAKCSLGIDTDALINISLLRVGLIGYADGWYDFLNQAVYYRLQATIRFYIAPGKYWDFQYQKGSGAPNFNQGDQFGTGLTMAF